MNTDKILIANILKKAETAYLKDILLSTNFLDACQLKLVEIALKKAKYMRQGDGLFCLTLSQTEPSLMTYNSLMN